MDARTLDERETGPVQQETKRDSRGWKTIGWVDDGHYVPNPDDPELPSYEEFDARKARMSETWVNDAGEMHNNSEGIAQIVYYPSGQIREITRAQNGLLTDGEYGEPAWQEFNKEGDVITTIHFRDGLQQDPDEETPALVMYFDDGKTLQQTCHYQAGQPHYEGQWCNVIYHPNGKISQRDTYRHGKREMYTGPDATGESMQAFNEDGELMLAKMYENGEYKGQVLHYFGKLKPR